MEKERIANNLKQERMSRGVTMPELADVIGVQTVSAYYRKEIGLLRFSLEEAMKLSKFYGKSVEELFGDLDE